MKSIFRAYLTCQFLGKLQLTKLSVSFFSFFFSLSLECTASLIYSVIVLSLICYRS